METHRYTTMSDRSARANDQISESPSSFLAVGFQVGLSGAIGGKEIDLSKLAPQHEQINAGLTAPALKALYEPNRTTNMSATLNAAFDERFGSGLGQKKELEFTPLYNKAA